MNDNPVLKFFIILAAVFSVSLLLFSGFVLFNWYHSYHKDINEWLYSIFRTSAFMLNIVAGFGFLAVGFWIVARLVSDAAKHKYKAQLLKNKADSYRVVTAKPLMYLEDKDENFYEADIALEKGWEMIQNDCFSWPGLAKELYKHNGGNQQKKLKKFYEDAGWDISVTPPSPPEEPKKKYHVTKATRGLHNSFTWSRD